MVNIIANIDYKSILETIKGEKPHTVENDSNDDLWPSVLCIFIYIRGQNLEHCYQGITTDKLQRKPLPKKQYMHIYIASRNSRHSNSAALTNRHLSWDYPILASETRWNGISIFCVGHGYKVPTDGEIQFDHG